MASGSKKVIYAALIGNALIAITKFIAAVITGSSAIFSEGIHSVVDTGNQMLLLYGLRKAKKPPDDKFPFGYGKEIYFWSFVVAILIFAVGAGLSLYEGIYHILHPKPVKSVMVNYIVLLFAMIIEGSAWLIAMKYFSKTKGNRGYLEAVKRGKDPSSFLVLFEDSAAILGLIVAFAGIFLGQVTGNLYFDGAASIIIGLLLAGTAIWLAYETKGLLIGESADPVIVQGIRQQAQSYEKILYINEILTLHMGPEFILVNISVEFVDEATAPEIETVVNRLSKQIKESYPRIKRIFVEAEPRENSPPSVSK